MDQEVNTTFITEPTECPCCEYPLEKVGDQLFCRNIACPAQTAKKVEHFAKVLGIKGLGPKSIEKLQVMELTELFYLDKEEVAEVLGNTIATKLLDEIERAKGAMLETVLASFSIPLIGNTASKKLCLVVSSIDEINQETCKQAGLGSKATQNLLTWLETEYLELKEFLPFTFKSSNNATSGDTVCITGKLKSFNKKADAEKQLQAAGFTVVDSVTKTTKYLVDEGNAGSSKREKAEKYGIIIITDLNDLLKVKN
jgi:NAD-dependent DNA ligase